MSDIANKVETLMEAMPYLQKYQGKIIVIKYWIVFIFKCSKWSINLSKVYNKHQYSTNKSKCKNIYTCCY